MGSREWWAGAEPPELLLLASFLHSLLLPDPVPLWQSLALQTAWERAGEQDWPLL